MDINRSLRSGTERHLPEKKLKCQVPCLPQIRFSLNELRYAIAVDRERHFGRAAEACNVSQPALSFALRKLESSLGIRLFERSANGVMPTVAGSLIVAESLRIMRSIDSIVSVACRRSGKVGQLRLYAGELLVAAWLPFWMSRLSALFSDGVLIMDDMGYKRSIEGLLSGAGDFYLSPIPIGIEREKDIAVQLLWEEPYCVLMSQEHALSRCAEVCVDELLKHRIVLLGGDDVLRNHLGWIVGEKLPKDENLMEARSLVGLLAQVHSSNGVAVLPASLVSILMKSSSNLQCRDLICVQHQPVLRVGLFWNRYGIDNSLLASVRRSLEGSFSTEVFPMHLCDANGIHPCDCMLSFSAYKTKCKCRPIVHEQDTPVSRTFVRHDAETHEMNRTGCEISKCTCLIM